MSAATAEQTAEELLSDLARLVAASPDGLTAIRRWLILQREHWGVDDVIVVAEGGELGRQVFRAGSRPIVSGWAASVALDGRPGIHTDPPVVLPAAEEQSAARLCYRSLQFDVAEQRSNVDPLTGLENRHAFETALRAATENAARYGWNATLVLLDLDDFKLVNDEHGHQAGDLVLRSVAMELHRVIRRGDVAARIGGDEFALVLSAIDQRELGHLMARLERALRTAAPHAISFSWGAASTPVDAVEPTELHGLADEQLYARKRRR